MKTKSKKLYLADIAKEKFKDDVKYALSVLMPHDMIFAQVENVDLLVMVEESDHRIQLSSMITDIKIKEEYLQLISRKDRWTGNAIISSTILIDDNPYIPEGNICPMYVRSEDGLSISIDDLFVYEHDLTDLEARLPDVFMGKQTDSTETEFSLSERKSLYTLIGVFLDMLVNKTSKNYSDPPSLPGGGQKFLFESQAALIRYIDESYEKHGHGLKKSSLEENFSKANKEFNKRIAGIEEENMET